MSHCRAQAASHAQQSRSSQSGQVLAGLSHVASASPRLQGQQSRSLTGSDQAQAAAHGRACRSSQRCCAQAASVAATLPNAMVRVRIGLAASTGRLDLSECDLTDLPLAVCELTDLQVCWALCFWQSVMSAGSLRAHRLAGVPAAAKTALLPFKGHDRRYASWQTCRCAGRGSMGHILQSLQTSWGAQVLWAGQQG